ncbi:flagellin, partial [Kurthia sibirica]
VKALTAEITRIANNTEFNTQKLLNGSFSAKKFHIGANAGQNISLTIGSMDAGKLGVSGISISSQTAADTAITTINTAITTVSAQRSDLGAVQNRLEHTINNLGATSENLSAAESRIRDTDMAKEMMEFTKNNILTQAAQSMLAQANQQPQGVLQLLQ